MPTMFRKRKDANEEMAMGRVVGVRNASPAHRVAQLHEREGEAAIITVEELPGHEGPRCEMVLGGECGPARESPLRHRRDSQRAVVLTR